MIDDPAEVACEKVTMQFAKNSELPVLGNISPIEKAREVQIRVIFLRIGDIDTLNEKFYAEILIESKWEEPKLRYEFESRNTSRSSNSSNMNSFLNSSAVYQKEEREFNNANKYWNPHIYVENVLNEPKQQVFYKIKKEPISGYQQNAAPEDVNVNFKSSNEALNQPEGQASANEAEAEATNISNVKADSYSYWMYEYRKMKGSFFEKLELDYFPVDVQDLSVSITTFKSNKQVKLVQNEQKPSMVKFQKTLDHHIWRLYEHVEVKWDHDDEENEQTHSCSSFNRRDFAYHSKRRLRRNDRVGDANVHKAATFAAFPTAMIAKFAHKQSSPEIVRSEEPKNPVISFQCRAARRPGYFYWNAFLPIFLITSVVFTSFAIDVDKQFYRLPVSATLLLTSVTFRWGYSTRCLPTVNYLTSLDKYSIGSLVFIYLCLMWHGITIFFHGDMKTLIKIDRVVLVLLLLVYIVMHVILIIWLRSAYSLRKYMVERDHDFYLHKINHRSSIISQDNIAAEAAERENGVIFQVPQNAWSGRRKSSVFSLNTNHGEFHPPSRLSIRRFSNQFKNLVLSKTSKTSETIHEVHSTPTQDPPA